MDTIHNITFDNIWDNICDNVTGELLSLLPGLLSVPSLAFQRSIVCVSADEEEKVHRSFATLFQILSWIISGIMLLGSYYP